MDDNSHTLSWVPKEGAAEDKRLVQQCLDGDERAWRELVGKYKRLICSVPFKYGLNREDCADIFQNVCVTLYTNLPKVRKVESLRSWLITVATNKCFHWMKNQRQNVEFDALEQEIAEGLAPVPPMMLREIEEEQQVRDAIRRLTPRCAQLVKMLFFEQPPAAYEVVAKKFGLAIGSIGFIRGRCLDRLHKILMELGF